MRILAISGSARRASTNTAMLRAVARIAAPDHDVIVADSLAGLPVFSPDLEDAPLPVPVARFAAQVAAADGLILSSPEYVRAIPGGLKNAIDWLVSRDEIVGKPIALMHASHRGDDMLEQLRIVLGTVSDRFASDPFLRFDLMKRTPEKIAEILGRPGPRAAILAFLSAFARQVRS